MIQRPEELLPSHLIDDLEKVVALKDPWMELHPNDGERTFRSRLLVDKLPILLAQILRISENPHQDMAGLLGWGRWFKDGPKLLRPTPEQAESLSQVEINLELKDYSQPYPACFVEYRVGPFLGCLCYRHSPNTLILQLASCGNLDDIVTFIRDQEGVPIETFLNTLDEGCEELLEHSLKVQRVALNLCLAMSNFGHQCSPAFPKALKVDESYAKEEGERGQKARVRVRRALHRVDFTRPIVIRRTTPPNGESVPTGKTVKAHWVRGHWKMQPHGKGMSERKRILIAPYLTHAEEGPLKSVTAYVDRR